MKAKKSNREVNVPILLLGVAFIVIGCSLGITSFAWFYVPTSTAQVKDIDGKAVGNYFDGGDGTASNPYGISTAKQLYYFNWLQDLGYFNQDKKNNETGDDADAGDGVIDKQYYFILKENINAEDYVLPPAGTKTYPFVGNFNGNGKTISNLRISNSWSELTDHPTGAESTQVSGDIYMLKDAEIVGFFGIIGQYTNGSPTSSTDDETSTTTVTGSVNCKTKTSSTTSTYTIRSVSGTGDSQTTTYINSVDNLYFDNLEVSTVANATLAGLLAGYVNGNMKYCGVRSGYFDFGTTVTGAMRDDVVGTSNSLLSKYSIIGDYSSAKNFVWTGQPTSSGTSGNDWGGSIDIASLVKRANYIAKHGDSSWDTSTGSRTIDTDFNADLYYSKKWNWDDAAYSGQYAALNDETYLPLNINLATATISGTYEGDQGSYYTSGTNTTEPVLSSNTGYIVGRLEGTRATPRLHNKAMASPASDPSEYSSKTNGIQHSINITDQSGKIDTSKGTNGTYSIFDYANLSFFYVDSTISSSTSELKLTTYRILDSENGDKTWCTENATKDVSECGFDTLDSGYFNVKHNFSKMLNEANTDELLGGKKTGTSSSGTAMPFINLNGIQLFKISGDELEKGSYSNVTIDGVLYATYQMYKGGINFHLKEDGRLKMVLGTYVSSGNSASYNLPYLYEVYRSEDKTEISSVKRISAVYKKTDSKGKTSYLLKYKDDATPDDSWSISMNLENLYSTSGTVMQPRRAYYLEIPLEKGDYFFASPVSTSNCPYIMYLDIAANAGNKESGGSTDIPPIDFVYYSDTSKKTIKKIDSKKTVDGKEISDYTPSNVTFTISGSPSKIYFWRVETTVEGVQSITLYYAATGTVKVVGGGTADNSKSSDDYTSN